MNPNPPLKVLLVDDHKIVRDGLRALLEPAADLCVVGESANGRRAIALALELQPDVVVLDLTMPDMNGIEAARQLRQQRPGCKILVLSMHADRQFVARALGEGAAGYMLKEGAFEELATAIRAVASGQTYLSPAVAGLVVADYRDQLAGNQRQRPAPASEISAREREVWQLISEGHATKEIAARLGVSVKTIETHRQQLMKKLSVGSVAGLTKLAIREGLTPA